MVGRVKGRTAAVSSCRFMLAQIVSAWRLPVQVISGGPPGLARSGTPTATVSRSRGCDGVAVAAERKTARCSPPRRSVGEVIDTHLRRIDALDPALTRSLSVFDEQALATAVWKVMAHAYPLGHKKRHPCQSLIRSGTEAGLAHSYLSLSL